MSGLNNRIYAQYQQRPRRRFGAKRNANDELQPTPVAYGGDLSATHSWEGFDKHFGRQAVEVQRTPEQAGADADEVRRAEGFAQVAGAIPGVGAIGAGVASVMQAQEAQRAARESSLPKLGATRRSATGGMETLMDAPSGARWVASVANAPAMTNFRPGDAMRNSMADQRVVSYGPAPMGRKDKNGMPAGPQPTFQENRDYYRPGDRGGMGKKILSTTERPAWASDPTRFHDQILNNTAPGAQNAREKIAEFGARNKTGAGMTPYGYVKVESGADYAARTAPIENQPMDGAGESGTGRYRGIAADIRRARTEAPAPAANSPSRGRFLYTSETPPTATARPTSYFEKLTGQRFKPVTAEDIVPRKDNPQLQFQQYVQQELNAGKAPSPVSAEAVPALQAAANSLPGYTAHGPALPRFDPRAYRWAAPQKRG